MPRFSRACQCAPPSTASCALHERPARWSPRRMAVARNDPSPRLSNPSSPGSWRHARMRRGTSFAPLSPASTTSTSSPLFARIRPTAEGDGLRQVQAGEQRHSCAIASDHSRSSRWRVSTASVSRPWPGGVGQAAVMVALLGERGGRRRAGRGVGRRVGRAGGGVGCHAGCCFALAGGVGRIEASGNTQPVAPRGRRRAAEVLLAARAVVPARAGALGRPRC